MNDIATARRMIDAWNDGNVDRMIEFWAQDGDWIWEDAPDFPDRKVVRGREAVEAHLRDIVNLFGEMRITLSQIRQMSDEVLIVGSAAVHGAASGIELEFGWAHLVTFDNGKVRRYRAFTDVQQALDAAASLG
jgi:ketosteroid isomerase-like protein